MSAEVITFPQVVTTLTPFAVAAAPALVGLGLAAAAGVAAHKLKADYQKALTEFNERAEAAEMQRAAWRATAEAKAAGAESLASVLTISGDATAATFVEAALGDAVRLAEHSGLVEIQARAQELLESMRAGAQVEEITEQVLRLNTELYATLSRMAASDKHAPAIEAMFAAVRREVEAIESEAQREPLLQQLARLEALPPDERSVAMQGMANVRDRAGRLIQAQARVEAEREERREVAAQSVAMLQALSKVPDAPEAGEAVKMLEQLGAMFSAAQAPSLIDLEAFHAKAKALFDACQDRLDKAAVAAYVADSVADTLAELGYKVAQVSSEGAAACMVSVDESTGMVVNIGKDGQVQTEMVAFDAGASEPDKAAQERVCKLVDDVFEGLKRRDIQIKEKVRRNLKPHGLIRVVERPQTETAPIAAEQLKERVLS